MKLSVKPAPIRTVEIFDEDDLHVLLKIKTFFGIYETQIESVLDRSDRFQNIKVKIGNQWHEPNKSTQILRHNTSCEAYNITWNPRGLSNGSFQPFGQTEKVTLSLNLEFCGIQDSMAKWEVVATPIWYICVGI